MGSAGAIAAATLPASGQQPGGPAAPPPQAAKRNPLTQYPKPPTKDQHQEPPGLASMMDPKPDHGETSYKGADVAINYLPVEEPDAREVVQLIQAEGRKAVVIPGDIRDEAFCTQLVSRPMGLAGWTLFTAG
jgi:hypothetical protein